MIDPEGGEPFHRRMPVEKSILFTRFFQQLHMGPYGKSRINGKRKGRHFRYSPPRGDRHPYGIAWSLQRAARSVFSSSGKVDAFTGKSRITKTQRGGHLGPSLRKTTNRTNENQGGSFGLPLFGETDAPTKAFPTPYDTLPPRSANRNRSLIQSSLTPHRIACGLSPLAHRGAFPSGCPTLKGGVKFKSASRRFFNKPLIGRF